MILLVTITSGRPKTLEPQFLPKCVKSQTTQDFQWLIVCDNWEGYKFPANAIVIKRDNSKDTMHSMCENWLCALEYIEKNDIEKIIVLEDDDFYHREYVLEMSKLLDTADLAGFEQDAYYHLLSRKSRRTHNVGFASLAATGFTRKVIPYFKECVNLGIPAFDKPLWLGIKEESQMPQPPIFSPSGTTIQPPPAQFVRVRSKWNGSRALADNFTGIVGKAPEIKWSDDKPPKLMLVTNEARINEKGNIENEHPRHIGLKEPWHGGTQGASNHSPSQGGGSDIWGDKLKEWMGASIAQPYLAITKDPSRSPYPPYCLIPMPADLG